MVLLCELRRLSLSLVLLKSTSPDMSLSVLTSDTDLGDDRDKWELYLDEANNYYYWYNEETGETKWDTGYEVEDDESMGSPPSSIPMSPSMPMSPHYKNKKVIDPAVINKLFRKHISVGREDAASDQKQTPESHQRKSSKRTSDLEDIERQAQVQKEERYAKRSAEKKKSSSVSKQRQKNTAISEGKGTPSFYTSTRWEAEEKHSHRRHDVITESCSQENQQQREQEDSYDEPHYNHQHQYDHDQEQDYGQQYEVDYNLEQGTTQRYDVYEPEHYAEHRESGGDANVYRADSKLPSSSKGNYRGTSHCDDVDDGNSNSVVQGGSPYDGSTQDQDYYYDNGYEYDAHSRIAVLTTDGSSSSGRRGKASNNKQRDEYHESFHQVQEQQEQKYQQEYLQGYQQQEQEQEQQQQQRRLLQQAWGDEDITQEESYEAQWQPQEEEEGGGQHQQQEEDDWGGMSNLHLTASTRLTTPENNDDRSSRSGGSKGKLRGGYQQSVGKNNYGYGYDNGYNDDSPSPSRYPHGTGRSSSSDSSSSCESGSRSGKKYQHSKFSPGSSSSPSSSQRGSAKKNTPLSHSHSGPYEHKFSPSILKTDPYHQQQELYRHQPAQIWQQNSKSPGYDSMQTHTQGHEQAEQICGGFESPPPSSSSSIWSTSRSTGSGKRGGVRSVNRVAGTAERNSASGSCSGGTGSRTGQKKQQVTVPILNMSKLNSPGEHHNHSQKVSSSYQDLSSIDDVTSTPNNNSHSYVSSHSKTKQSDYYNHSDRYSNSNCFSAGGHMGKFSPVKYANDSFVVGILDSICDEKRAMQEAWEQKIFKDDPHYIADLNTGFSDVASVGSRENVGTRAAPREVFDPKVRLSTKKADVSLLQVCMYLDCVDLLMDYHISYNHPSDSFLQYVALASEQYSIIMQGNAMKHEAGIRVIALHSIFRECKMQYLLELYDFSTATDDAGMIEILKTVKLDDIIHRYPFVSYTAYALSNPLPPPRPEDEVSYAPSSTAARGRKGRGIEGESIEKGFWAQMRWLFSSLKKVGVKTYGQLMTYTTGVFQGHALFTPRGEILDDYITLALSRIGGSFVAELMEEGDDDQEEEERRYLREFMARCVLLATPVKFNMFFYDCCVHFCEGRSGGENGSRGLLEYEQFGPSVGAYLLFVERERSVCVSDVLQLVALERVEALPVFSSYYQVQSEEEEEEEEEEGREAGAENRDRVVDIGKE